MVVSDSTVLVQLLCLGATLQVALAALVEDQEANLEK